MGKEEQNNMKGEWKEVLVVYVDVPSMKYTTLVPLTYMGWSMMVQGVSPYLY